MFALFVLTADEPREAQVEDIEGQENPWSAVHLEYC